MLIPGRPVLFLVPLLLFIVLASCNSDHYEYRAEIAVDDVIVADSVTAGDSALVVYTVPGGCNRFPKLETNRSQDTIRCMLTLEFYYKGGACAHGSWIDSLYAVIDPGEAGDYLLVYRDSDSTSAVVPLTVLSPS